LLAKKSNPKSEFAHPTGRVKLVLHILFRRQHITLNNLADNRVSMQDLPAHAPLEQFALPHQFTPRLSLFGACVAIAAALTRIFVGSLIGALWGVAIWSMAASKHWLLTKSFIIFLLVVGLAASLTALMWAVKKVTMKLDPCVTSSSAPPVI
jgi:hypothetical protein